MSNIFDGLDGLTTWTELGLVFVWTVIYVVASLSLSWLTVGAIHSVVCWEVSFAMAEWDKPLRFVALVTGAIFFRILTKG